MTTQSVHPGDNHHAYLRLHKDQSSEMSKMSGDGLEVKQVSINFHLNLDFLFSNSMLAAAIN